MDKLRRFNNEETDKVNIYESTIIRMSNDSDHNIVFVVDWLEGDNIKIVFRRITNKEMLSKIQLLTKNLHQNLV